MMRFGRLLILFGGLTLVFTLVSGDQRISTSTRGKIEKARTEISDIPWDPNSLATAPKLVYGTDDRIDVYQETDSLRLRLAAATCALISASDVTDNGNGSYTIQTFAYREFGLPACDGEPFGNQPVAAFCTGWLAGSNLIATAGHCFDQFDIDSGDVVFVFGFDMMNATTPVTVVDASQVYRSVSIVARDLTSSEQDYCLVRVDRPVTAPGAFPLGIRRTGQIAVGTPVGVIGHPAGLPTKIAFGPTTAVADTSDPNFFVANLDTYGGNSGSPVFDQNTGVVEGILVRGNADYVDNNTCFTSNHLTDAEAGEESTKTTVFQSFIPMLEADVNGDGAIDASDIQLTINAALGIDISPFSADVNNDGSVDAVDVQSVINAALMG